MSRRRGAQLRDGDPVLLKLTKGERTALEYVRMARGFASLSAVLRKMSVEEVLRVAEQLKRELPKVG